MSSKPKIANSQDDTYGIVFGSDRDVQDAQYEIEQLAMTLPEYRSLGRLFKKDNQYYRVILFRSEEEAERNLNTVSQVYGFIRRDDIRNLQEWCPNWLQNARTEQTIRYYDCP